MIDTPLAQKTRTYWKMAQLLRNPAANATNRIAAESALGAMIEQDVPPKLRNRCVEVIELSKKHRKAS